MKLYPKIPGSNKIPNKPCIAFEKYDGSNLRFEWSKKRGFYKFGTRRRLFDESDPYLGKSVPIFMKTYSENLTKILVDNKRFRGAENVIVFAEFFGKESFAGQHKLDDPTLELILFDVSVHKFGFLGPRDFINIFEDIKIARKIYEGKPNGQFLENVRNGKFDVPRNGEWDIMEGAVCKGGSGGTDLWMAKVKTYKYMEKLKEVYKDKWKEYFE